MKTAEPKSQAESTHSWSPNSRDSAFFHFNQQNTESFFAPAMIQPKLKIGEPNDRYEKQADRVADAVVQMSSSAIPIQREPMEGKVMVQTQAIEEEEVLQTQPLEEEDELQMKSEPLLQRKCKACEEESLQKKANASANFGNTASEAISSKLKSRNGSGNQLSQSIQSEMSQKIGADFSSVNIHTDSDAVQMSQSLGARAFTQGNDIYFNSGEYNPHSSNGKRLLAHELTHVVQQSGGGGYSSPAISTKRTFTPGRPAHNHSPIGWGKVKWHAIKNCDPFSELGRLCCIVGGSINPLTVLSKALVGKMYNAPLARKHLWHYMFGGGGEINVNLDLENLIKSDLGVRARFANAISSSDRGYIFIDQGDYSVKDFQLAFGGIDRVDYEVSALSGGFRTVDIWFIDRYDFHPVGFGYVNKGTGDFLRHTNCIHAAAVEEKANGAADYWMKGEATFPLSLFKSRKVQPFLQRKCEECEDEENIQKKANNSSNFVNSVSGSIGIQLQSERGSGHQLPHSIKSEMSQKIGVDFSGVNIHTDSEAVQMSQSLGARAFTHGNDIYFNDGEYSPQSADGKHLLAHELTHVVQQNSGIQTKMIQRACSSEAQTEYDSIASEIRELELYQNVPYHHNAIYSPVETRRVAEIIIRQAKNRDDCLYYIQYLHTLFSTSEASSSSVSQSWGPVLSEAAQEEQDRLQDPAEQQNASFEEYLSGDPNRQWTQVRGQGGKFYYVDTTDISNIFVKAKVKLEGDQQQVDQAKQLEDGIEKEASILGYTVDLEFVDTTGRDVFEAEVDPSKWPTSGNWVGNVEVMAHELHHLLNLRDRYNYIESHSDNEEMYVANRIHWFREEFNRPDDPNRFTSFMGEGSLVTDEDICTVIQSGNVSACVNQRSSLRSTAQADKTRANAKVQRLIEVLSGIIPPSLVDPRGGASTILNAQSRINQTAQLVFNAQVSNSDIEAALNRIRNFLISGRIYLENATAPECRNEHVYFMQNPLTFVICPSFSGLNAEDKQKELIRVAYRIYQQISLTGQRAAMFGQPLDPANAQKWADFVIQAHGRI